MRLGSWKRSRSSFMYFVFVLFLQSHLMHTAAGSFTCWLVRFFLYIYVGLGFSHQLKKTDTTYVSQVRSDPVISFKTKTTLSIMCKYMYKCKKKKKILNKWQNDAPKWAKWIEFYLKMDGLDIERLKIARITHYNWKLTKCAW